MQIRKMSDIPGAVTPNRFDEGSSISGLSASSVREILYNDATKAANLPLDADDLSRCIVAIEQFKANDEIKDDVKKAAFKRLAESSTLWEAILEDYDQLKSGFLSSLNYPLMDEAMLQTVNAGILP